MVKISVIVPVHNGEYLEKCLDSLINQTLKDIEIICVPGQFSDFSLEILNNYAKNNDRMVIVNDKFQSSQIKWFDLINGDYITFVDSDDWIELNCLEKIYNNAVFNNSDLVLFNYIEYMPNNKFHKRIYLPIDENIDYNNFVFDYNLNNQLILNILPENCLSKLYRTSFLKENKIEFDHSYDILDNVSFHIESMLLAKNISYVPEFLYNHNKLNLGHSQIQEDTYYDSLIIFDIFNQIDEFLLKNNRFDEFKFNFIEFKISQSKENFNKTSDKFKENFYEKMREEFIKMNLTSDILKKISFKFYRFYILVINFEFNKFIRFKNHLNHTLPYIDKRKISIELEKFEDIGINLNESSKSIIVSLTSFPKRMHDIHYCLYSLLTQNFKPHKVILWLAKEQFPNGEHDIPDEVLKLKNNGLTIKWCKDIKSFKKLIPALKEYSNDYIVTADDDIYYPKDWLKNMWDAHMKYPNSIISSRSRKISFNGDKIDRYNDWKLNYNEDGPSYLIFPTGAGGTLFTPNSLDNKVFDEELFLKLCPSGDDIWFWAMAVLNKTKIYAIEKPMAILCYVNIARDLGLLNDTTLWDINEDGKNDVQIQNVLNKFPEILNELKK